MNIKSQPSTARFRRILIAGMLATTLSCSGDSLDPAGPTDPPGDPIPLPDPDSPVHVTEPVLVETTLSAVGRSDIIVRLSADETVSYVSIPPGSQPEADSIEVLNRTRDLTTGGPMVDGGLDPLPIPASVGDVLVITTYRLATIFERYEREVPEDNPPVIVRTEPPRGKTRVPLNSVIVIVFSEPVDEATATGSSVVLRRDGVAVPTGIGIDADGLTLQLTPETGLAPTSIYEVVVEPEVADRNGDVLEDRFTSDFATVTAQLSGEIVFESRRAGGSDIWLMKTDGSDLFQLTDGIGGGQATGPALSPDGSRIAFSLADPANGDEWEIYAINVDGTGLTNLTDDPEFDGWRPAWSPDGSQIAFFSTRDDPLNDEVYVMNADGSNVRRLTDNPADDANMTWSPDGSRIAWETNREGDFDIWIMDADGSNPVPLTVDPADEAWPAWSPDGTKIAFDTERDGNLEIYVINVDGSGLTNLTNDPAFDSAPAWSHDGSQLAFISDRDGGVDIWIMNADGSNPVNLTNDGFADFFPSFSP